MLSGARFAAVALALGAAASFAVSNVTQMSAIARQPYPAGSDPNGGASPADKQEPDAAGNGTATSESGTSEARTSESARPQRTSKTIDGGLLVRVGRDPLWLLGLVASIAGFAMEATALSIAPVVLVQPLIVAELAFAIPLAAFIAKHPLGKAEWTGIALVSSGLLALLIVVHPSNTPISAPPERWLLLFGSVAAVVLGLLAVSRRTGAIARTSLLAGAAGVTFGLLSIITKATTHQLAVHGIGFLGTWQPWVLAALGIVGMTLTVNTYQSGPLAVSLPLLDVGEPIAASLIATVVFGESLGQIGVTGDAILAAGIAAIVGGVASLDHSPLVRSHVETSATQDRREGRPADDQPVQCARRTPPS
ncbi:MAG: DMT family transporter [Acidimicrobiales bacterium]